MSLNWKMAAALIAVAALVVGAVGYVVLTREKNVLRLATTTSTYDSGLLDYILPEFEREYDCEIDVIAVGSGLAMNMGRSGDADVLLVHSPTAENAFVSDGYGEERCLVMYNNYVVVGPQADPADINHSASVSLAFKKIYDNGTADTIDFVTRGDGSGTHNKELSIWKILSLDASTFSNEWYIDPGAGMGAVLDMCEQLNAYTLSDDATYYQRQSEDLIPSLKMVYNFQKTDPLLMNQYSVIVLNETRFPHINHTLATSFKDWLVSQEGQDLIASYKRYGQQLFYPNAVGYTLSAASLCIEDIMSSHDAASLVRLVVQSDPDSRHQADARSIRW